MILDYDDPSVVYLSKQVKDVFEIFKFSTPDMGISWDSTALTWNTPADLVNVRPIVPRSHQEGVFDLIWMRGKYRHYTDYHTALVFWSDTIIEELDSISFGVDSLQLTRGLSKELQLYYFPFIASEESVSWSSSDEALVSVENGIVTALGEGTAIIRAETAGGLSAEIKIIVKPPDYYSFSFFDFGTVDSPVDNGAIQVTGSSLFEDSYGWTSPVLTRDRGAAQNAELRDFNMSSSDAYFNVFVEPGEYQLTITQGDLSYPHDNMNIYVNGQLKSSNVSTAAGSFEVIEFYVETEEDMLEFRFQDGGGSDIKWVVNSLKLNLMDPPTLIVDEDSIPTMHAESGNFDNKTISLRGINLKADTYLDISGTDASAFQVNPSTIAMPAGGALNPTIIGITYLPSAPGNHSALLIISSEGADDLAYQLKGSVISSMRENQQSTLRVFSAPGSIHFEGNGSYSIYNLWGQYVRKEKEINGSASVRLYPGIYLVKTGNTRHKVVVQ